jgi:uncharacterized protein
MATAALLTVSTLANHPSYDCDKVKKESAEGKICSSNRLMDLDRELSALYKQALPKSSKSDMLKAQQRGWIKGRNDCWKAENEAKCMENAYHHRIKELKEKYHLSNNTPAKKSTHYAFDKVLALQGITFHVQATDEGSLNRLKITPSGLKEVNSIIDQEIDGSVGGVEVADINQDGSPEIYVYVTSAGSGSYGSLVAYAANHKKSLSEIYLSPIEEDKKYGIGYMGHDTFSIVENYLGRRFPVYTKDDTNAHPTGGTRQLMYTLTPGEASWQLRVAKSTNHK